jgi:hypothetical protein
MLPGAPRHSRALFEMPTWYRRPVAVGSPVSADDVSVDAPERTLTGGHSKFDGRAMAGVAAAFALAAVLLLDPNIEENDGRDGDAQPASSGPKTRAAITPRRGSRDEGNHACAA